MQPRRQQPAITIRSARVADRLRVLTRDGRSQVEVIEEALDRMPEPAPRRTEAEVAARVAALREIIDQFDAGRIPSMAEFDAREYDERGLPR